MVHAHRLVRRPRRRGIHPAGIDLPASECLLLSHQGGRQPLEHCGGLSRVAQPEATNQNRTVLRDNSAQPVPVLGGPAGRVAGSLNPQNRRLARLPVDIEQ